jgi:hypothetical protein
MRSAPDVRVVGVALNRHQGDTEDTDPAGLATAYDCPPAALESPLDGQAAHERLGESLPAVHGQMGENPLCDTTEPDGSAGGYGVFRFNAGGCRRRTPGHDGHSATSATVAPES